MGWSARQAFFCGVASCLVLSSSTRAFGQIHWDVGVQGGAMKRFLFDRPQGAADASFGPTAQIHAHVAVYPLVRVGGYVSQDISPLGGDPAARDVTSAGARVKVMSPWPRAPVRAWLVVGVGYARVWARSYGTTLSPAPTPGPPGAAPPAFVEGAGGGFLELPVGIGVSYKLRKPWALFWEVTTRFGIAPTGSVYDPPGRRLTSPGVPATFAPPDGKDNLAIGLAMGVELDL